MKAPAPEAAAPAPAPPAAKEKVRDPLADTELAGLQTILDQSKKAQLEYSKFTQVCMAAGCAMLACTSHAACSGQHGARMLHA